MENIKLGDTVKVIDKKTVRHVYGKKGTVIGEMQYNNSYIVRLNDYHNGHDGYYSFAKYVDNYKPNSKRTRFSCCLVHVSALKVILFKSWKGGK